MGRVDSYPHASVLGVAWLRPGMYSAVVLVSRWCVLHKSVQKVSVKPPQSYVCEDMLSVWCHDSHPTCSDYLDSTTMEFYYMFCKIEVLFIFLVFQTLTYR